MTASLVLIFAVAAGYLAAHVAFDWLARRFLIVSAAEYLVLGILLGPQVSGLLTTSTVASLSPILTLALGWIGAIIGADFEIRRLLDTPARMFRIAGFESLITFSVVAGVEFFLLRQFEGHSQAETLLAAVTFGALGVASSSAGVYVVARLLGRRSDMLRQLETSTRVNAIVAIAIIGLTMAIVHADVPVWRPLTATEWAVVSISIGIIGGILFHVFLGDTPDADRLFIALVGGIVLVSGAATYMNLSPLLSGLFFGLVLVNSTTRSEALVATLAKVERPFYFVLLFFGGATWQPSARHWVLPVIAFLALRVLAKIGGSRLAARANDAIGDYGTQWGRALIGQGRVALAIGLGYLHQSGHIFPNMLFTAAVASVLFTEFFSARLVRSVVPDDEGPAPHEPPPAAHLTAGSDSTAVTETA